MKILICSDTYFNQTNGVVTVLHTLVTSLRELGHDVRVLSPSDTRKSFKKGDDYFLRSLPALYYPKERLCFTRKDPLIDELKSWKPDLIHSHTEGLISRLAISLSSKLQIPLVITTHTDFAKYIFGRFYDSPPVRVIGKVFGKVCYTHADAIVVPTKKSCGFMWLRSYLDRVTVIPNGISLETFQRELSPDEKAELFEQYEIPDDRFTLVSITRVSKEKNIMEILQYFHSLLRVDPEVQLVIVGDGPDRKRLQKYCESSGISEHVYFTGIIAPDDVYRYYKMGDVFVSASTFETQGMTYIEAMACGLPQVCRKDECLIDVIDNGENGFVYETEPEFTDAVSKLLLDSELREDMSSKALEKAESFSGTRFAERTVELYQKVLQKHNCETRQ